jgi:hypothetical protein
MQLSFKEDMLYKFTLTSFHKEEDKRKINYRFIDASYL